MLAPPRSRRAWPQARLISCASSARSLSISRRAAERPSRSVLIASCAAFQAAAHIARAAPATLSGMSGMFETPRPPRSSFHAARCGVMVEKLPPDAVADELHGRLDPFFCELVCGLEDLVAGDAGAGHGGAPFG